MSWPGHQLIPVYQDFSAENSDEKKQILRVGTIYLGPSWLCRVRVDQDS